jgi:hypothetical protein
MSLPKFQISCGQLIKSAVTILVFSTSFSAFAQSDCDSVLKRDVTIVQLTRHQQLGWLSLISEKDYRDSHTQIDAGASFLGIGVDGSYETFDRNRREYLSNQSYSYKGDEALNLLVSGVRDTAINAWLGCKLNSKFEGVQLLPEEYTDKVVAVRIKWKPPAGPIRSLKSTYQLRGASTSIRLPDEFSYEKDLTVFFDRRSPKQDFLLTANVEGYTAKTLKIPFYESPVSASTMIQRFIDTKNNGFQVIGQTRANEHGFLIMSGEWSPWDRGDTFFPPEHCCMKVRITNLGPGGGVREVNYAKPYVAIPPNSEVSILLEDEPTSYGDNRSKEGNPLRATLYIGSLPSTLR